MYRRLPRKLGLAALVLFPTLLQSVAAQELEVIFPSRPLPANPLGNGYNVAFFERGLSDALADPSAGAALSAALRQVHAISLRYPGGSFTYWYPHRREGLQAFKRAGFAEQSYNLWFPDKYGWAEPEAFFSFCRQAGLTAWYELNPAYLYDAGADTIGQLSPLPRDASKRDVTLDPARYLPLALEHAKDLARTCMRQGVDVVWEVGNEDYVYFEPEGYAAVAAAFIKAIREVSPTARFALCGDSESWDTRTWQMAMLRALREEGIESFDYSSVHCYLTGVGEFDAAGDWHPLPRSSGRELLSSTVRAWQLIRSMYLGDFRKILDDAGYTDTALALTEFSPVHPSHLGDAAQKALEHCMGRALGEAAIYPFVIEDCGALFSHDLVRSGEGATFFRRLDYTPAGKDTYGLPLEARVIGLVAPHAEGEVLHKDWSGTCVSAHPWGLYLTVANPDEQERSLSLSVHDLPPVHRAELERVSASDLSVADYPYQYHTGPGPVPEDGKVTLNVAPCSLTALSLLCR